MVLWRIRQISLKCLKMGNLSLGGVFTHPDHRGLKEAILIEIPRALKGLKVLSKIGVQVRKKHRGLRVPSFREGRMDSVRGKEHRSLTSA